MAASATEQYDIVIAYGLLHCMENEADVLSMIASIQRVTKPAGINVLCAFNGRHQDLTAHPGFVPTLLAHSTYRNAYEHWERLVLTDRDLHETHPHNKIPHTHSLTRILARKPS